MQTKEIKQIIADNRLADSFVALYNFIKNNISKYSSQNLSKIAEYANADREMLAAFYTPKQVCFDLVKELPNFDSKNIINVLEPSVGMGNFIEVLSERYPNKKIILDVIDIDNKVLKLLNTLLSKNNFKNIEVNYIHNDFLLYETDKKYDIVIGNPPFGKIDNKNLIGKYRKILNPYNDNTKNIFALFLEKALSLGDFVSFILPKSLLSAPEFNKTREMIENNHTVKSIVDFGEKGFENVKIETIGIVIQNGLVLPKYQIKVGSYITNMSNIISNVDMFDIDFNSWLIYKNDFFKKIKDTMNFGVYEFYRDRTITKKMTDFTGRIRVLKSRNIGNNKIVDIDNYDTFINNVDDLAVKKYINSYAILIPNLSYKPRACILPKNSITDGSVAILRPKINGFKLSKEQIEYYATEEFCKFYRIGRNLGTRSLNIDSNSINLWGIKRL